ncbi:MULTISPECIES: hypothetical protein [Bacillus]|uniref:hypothetical protein n=1 Tax=Bacillus TaxID=1386 RepID=UPI002DB7DE82|nr:hypothetical protein [Bacillus paralicheniformis]MEC1050224.1 hypothetical protein [Bacillus paralicheniformis]MEC1112239.1 hypothetical protein [Bacillus paralicheniformis]MEC1137977.1 hypothetical protein [Bacillus paralicheniformis]MEC1145382.1 hypothetical protein [Bacillus paralicheniformis]MEC1165871.1 hypothetical protein [Bacillus paralicheniformis]
MTNKKTTDQLSPANCSRHFEVCSCREMCTLRFGEEMRKRKEAVDRAESEYEKRRAFLLWLRLKRWGARRLIN